MRVVVALRRRLASLALAMGLAGCLSPEPIDFDRAQLIPEPAAKKVISSLVPDYDGGTMLPPYEQGDPPVPIRSITRVWLLTNDSIAMMREVPLGLDPAGVVCSGSLAKAQRLAEALTALGARVALERSTNPGFHPPCSSR
jgi:hypothetical protein